MVKVQIPFTGQAKKAEQNAPTSGEEGDDDDDEVGIMSESDVDDDIGDPDWEEVNENGDEDSPVKLSNLANLPQGGVTITITRPKRGRKGGDDDEGDDDFPVSPKKKRTLDPEELIRKSINRVKITEQLLKHKLSLLICLARGIRLVKIINCQVIRGLSMSVIDSLFKNRKIKSVRQFLEDFMKQFDSIFSVIGDDDIREKHMQQPFMLNLLDCFKNSRTTSLIELVVIFVACLKAKRPDLSVRIINVLRPVTLRADIIPKPNTNGATQKSIKKVQEPQQIVEKLDFWVEVYLEDEKKWCCVDLCNLKLDEPNVLTELSRPFHYLVSYDVDRYYVKPMEKTYIEFWYTPAFRKYRCEDKWWNSVMQGLGPADEVTKEETTTVEEISLNQAIPTSETAFRNHPLYVLEKHLLKYQGIYPPEVPPLGFFKDQPVYPRDCVQLLCSRETWLRKARTVKLNETPYKIVTARPKRDRYSGSLIRDIPLELFGEWQTKDYEPPEAKDGKVPRNCYGNVDMYQECMLPIGCSWLKLPGLQRIANKLGIDCAQAVVGFDNHCGRYGAHPVMEGFIVCKEFEDTLRMAWEEEQVNAAKREAEKREKLIYDNWKRLLKAVIIREKLRVKYKNS